MPPQPARDGAGAIRHLSGLYDAVEAHVNGRREEFDTFLDEATKQGAIVEMRTLVGSVRSLQRTLSWVDAINDPPLDLGTKYFVELAARRLVRADAQVLPVAVGDSSYATFSNPYTEVIEDWGGTNSLGEEIVIIVFLPRRERRSALLHPLIIHELGHAVCQTHQLTKEVVAAALARKRLITRFGKAMKTVVARDGVLDQEAALTIMARLRHWVEEALCDAIACEYLGPTYLYSFVTEVLAGNLDQPGPRHPPPRLRVALMLNHLDERGWSETMQMSGAKLDEWLRELAGASREHRDEIEFLVWVLQTISKDLRSRVAKSVSPFALEPDRSALKEIAKLLDAGIPPAQRLDCGQLDPRNVALGCWCFALAEAGGDIASLPQAAEGDALGELLPKGLELSALANAWG